MNQAMSQSAPLSFLLLHHYRITSTVLVHITAYLLPLHYDTVIFFLLFSITAYFWHQRTIPMMLSANLPRLSGST